MTTVSLLWKVSKQIGQSICSLSSVPSRGLEEILFVSKVASFFTDFDTKVSAAKAELKQKLPFHQLQKPNHALSAALQYARKFLKFHVINNWRGLGFVPSVLLVEWRRMMEHVFRFGIDFETHCERQEASEFVEAFLKVFCVGKDYSVSMIHKDGPKVDKNLIHTFVIQTFPPPDAMERFTGIISRRIFLDFPS